MVHVDPERYPSEIPREIDLPLGEQPIHEYLRHYAETDPDRTAINYYGRTLSYADLDEASDALATYLTDQGYGVGDTLLLYLPNTPQFFVGYYAALKVGMVASSCSPMAKAHRLSYQLEDGDAKVLLALDEKADVVASARDDSPLEEVIYTRFEPYVPDDPVPSLHGSMEVAMDASEQPTDETTCYLQDVLAECPADPPRPSLSMDQTVVLQYTGGTTGVPKGCQHTYRTIINGAGRYATVMLYDGDDRHLCYLPIFHISGKTSVVDAPFLHGATVVLLTRADPEGVMQAVDAHRPTQCYMAAKTTREILEHPHRERYDLTSFTTNPVSGFSESVTRKLCERWHDQVGADLFECSYGLTETHKATTFTHKLDVVEPGFVGLPAHDVDVVIRDWETHEPVAVGETGEISVECSSMMAGYYGKPEETAEAFQDGYLLTGDLGRLTEESYLYYLGRRKNLIKSSGFSVAPKEVEGIIENLDGVANAAVLGRGEETNDEDVVAFVSVSDESLTVDDLEVWCADRMAAYKQPDEFVVIDAIPHTDVGKVDRESLQDRYF